MPFALACSEKKELPMKDRKPKRDFTAHQQKIIKRYYDNIDAIALQRLAELVGELYLAEGKKKEKAWQSVLKAMEKLEVPKSRIDHLMAQKNPVLMAELVKELQVTK
jgi:hypothetical protein